MEQKRSEGMERVNGIWRHPRYQECVKRIQELEADRRFCRHTPEHFLDVARLAWILALESGVSLDRELVYGAALLHDIGRHLQYEKGIPHEEASAGIAEEILRDCGFSREESETILQAIRGHRTRQEGKDFPALLYRADKLSRSCFSCPAEAECNWPKDKKNLDIVF